MRTEQRSHRPFPQWEAPPGRVPAMNLLTNSLTSHPRSGGKFPNLGLRSVGRGTNERMYKMPDTQFVSPTLCCPFLLGSSLFWRVLGPGTQEEEASQRPKPPTPERYKTLGVPSETVENPSWPLASFWECLAGPPSSGSYPSQSLPVVTWPSPWVSLCHHTAIVPVGVSSLLMRTPVLLY